MDVSIIGYIAAVVSTASFAPQAWKIIKTRKTDGLSTGMYTMTVAGFALWLGYGIATNQWGLISSNAICLVLSAFILIMKCAPAAIKQTVCETVARSGD